MGSLEPDYISALAENETGKLPSYRHDLIAAEEIGR